MVKNENELALLLWTITGDYHRKDIAQKTGFDWVIHTLIMDIIKPVNKI